MRQLSVLWGATLALLLFAGCAPTDTGTSGPAASVAEAPSPAATQAVVEEDIPAEEVLRRVSDYLASMDGFRLKATIESDEVPEPGIKVEFEADLEMAFDRSGRLRVDYHDDELSKTLWIVGGEATLFDPSVDVYSTAAVEGDIPTALETLTEHYDVGVPLDDFLYDDPFARLSAGIEDRRYLGVHRVGDGRAHHAVFDQGDFSWQIWVGTGDTPDLRKLVITYGDEDAAPRYAIEIDSFMAGVPGEAAFAIDMPEDSSKIPFTEVTTEEKL
jgi:hypothetical protein